MATVTKEKEIQILGLIEQGVSERAIARKTGVDRGTVRAIRNPSHTPRRSTHPIERCGTCGRMIELPCLACLAERHADAKAAMATILAESISREIESGFTAERPRRRD